MELAPRSLTLKNGKTLILRSPTSDDATELYKVARVNIATSDHLLTQLDEFNFTIEQQRSRIASYASNPGDLWIIPVVDGKIVGMLDFRSGARRRNSHQGDFGMSLLPEYRGLGIGTAMIEALLEWAREHSAIEQVRLKAHSRNDAGLGLYKKMGFKEEGRELRGLKFADGVYDDVICMVQDLI